MLCNLMEEIASSEILEEAYGWLCKRRKDHSANSDVSDLRWRWADIKPRLPRQLLAGQYRLEPTRRVWLRSESKFVEVWSAQDALVLKAVAIVLSRAWHDVLSDRCFHLTGRGGAKATVREVATNLPEHQFVFRTRIERGWVCVSGL